MSESKTLGLFEGYGIELEYMIVDAHTLRTLPISDLVLMDIAGKETAEVAMGDICWSNELAMHVIELKSNGPKSNLLFLQGHMQRAVQDMNDVLKKFNACLLPTAMHPFFNPQTDLKLWQHENKEIYSTYDRIFSCKGHGWANLQAIHINLPFNGDAEFCKLHAAVRTILPLLPALAASSPFFEGKLGPLLDNRLGFYFKNQRRISSILGAGIPEAVESKKDYETIILNPMYKDIAPFDPQGELQYEWLNSRAAIARFDRNAIEIRLLDIQECLPSDFSIIAATVAILKSLVAENWSGSGDQNKLSHFDLRVILDGVLEQGLDYRVENDPYLKLFNIHKPLPVREFFATVLEDLNPAAKAGFEPYSSSMETILSSGCCSERLLKAVGSNPTFERLTSQYKVLARCLHDGVMFEPEPP